MQRDLIEVDHGRHSLVVVLVPALFGELDVRLIVSLIRFIHGMRLLGDGPARRSLQANDPEMRRVIAPHDYVTHFACRQQRKDPHAKRTDPLLSA